VTPAPLAPPASAGEVPGAPSIRRLVVNLSGALEDSITRALPREDRALGDELTQVVNRLLVWDLQVSRDGRKGDLLEVLWSPAAPVATGMPVSSEPVVEAVRYASQKLGSRFAVYRFHAEGARWPRYFRPDGTELEERLVDAPIREYDQITSLLRDGRRHKGVDFRAPVGAKVRAPFTGIVKRKNWGWKANGNCLELDEVGGKRRRALFLHLNELPRGLKVGDRFTTGQVIAESGNTGRSFAPHLHYQLMTQDERVIDPFDSHRSYRRSLSTAHRGAFEAEVLRLDGLLGTTVAGK
jgi:murein DD-endopeptidase MepM/ murein hydrolase activator NlpD